MFDRIVVTKWKKSKAGNNSRGSIKVHCDSCAIFYVAIVPAAVALFTSICLLILVEEGIDYLTDC
jgi:hypothetical protein